LGYKKIQDKRQELEAKQQVLFKFRSAATEVNAQIARAAEAARQLENAKSAIASSVGAMFTGGVPEFEAYKKSLLGIAKGGTFRPLPMDPVEKVVKNADAELRAMLSAWEDKLAASCPKDIKPGMTFKDAPTGRIYEVKSSAEKATNPRLQGDAAIWFDGEFFKDGKSAGKSPIDLASLKKMKYLKTD
jgi:hypothetical protein